jgi:arylamine N-acetyltransferase
VIRDHIEWGAGGTCFSLTSALAKILRSLGWEVEYILADRRYGQNTHCALMVQVDGAPHLLDPGFLIVDPIRLKNEGEHEIRTAFNSLVLAPEADRNRVSLSTVRRGSKTYRLTYKTSPVDEGEFLKAWDASFGWDMMKYPLLTSISGSKQIYLNGTRFQISDSDSVERRMVPTDNLVDDIAAEFHIHISLVARAVDLLRSRGDFHGEATSC